MIVRYPLFGPANRWICFRKSLASKPKIGGLEISENEVVLVSKSRDSIGNWPPERRSKKLCLFVKKLVFATKGLKEEAFLDYFATKLHFFVKKVVCATKELNKRLSWIILHKNVSFCEKARLGTRAWFRWSE